MKPPIFVIGNPRSGTTLLRLIINNHRNIVLPPECGFIVWLYEKYKNWSIEQGQSQEKIKQFVVDLMQCKKFETWKIDATAIEQYLLSKKTKDYAELVDEIYKFFAGSKKSNVTQWGDKNNFHVKFIDVINTIFPNSLFIHIVRDGRDVACSYKALAIDKPKSIYAPNLPADAKAIALEWLTNNQAAIASFDKIDPSRVLLVRYEDLVSETELQVRRICLHLSQEYDENMLIYHEKNRSEEQEPKDFLQWKQKTVESPTTSEIGKYKLLLTADEVGTFNNIAGTMLKKFNYEI